RIRGRSIPASAAGLDLDLHPAEAPTEIQPVLSALNLLETELEQADSLGLAVLRGKLDGKTQEAIAAELRVSRVTVREALDKVRRRMKKLLAEERGRAEE